MNASVIIVTYNRASSLAEALHCLVHQTQPPREVIVVDNNSTDHTYQVVNSFGDKLNIHYVQEPRQGIPFARNRGIAMARSEIIAFMDDDCRPRPHWLEELVKPFYRDPRIGQVGGEILPALEPTTLVEEFCNDDAMLRVNAEYDPDIF